MPALPSDGMVDKGSELTFRLSANAGYKVKALTIGDATYSDVPDNTITKKVKIEKETAVSAVVEAEATPTPDTGIFTDTQGNKVTIAPLEDYYGEITGYRLTGDIYIEEINSAAFKAKLDTLNGKDLYTDSLNINCFTNQNSTLTAKEITPEVLTGVLTIGKEKKFSAPKLNNKTADNSPIEIPFKSDATDYFDITDLAQFSFSENFKLTNDSKIFLRAERTAPDPSKTEDHTEYAKTTELLSLINNPKIKHKITVGKVQLRGNVKDLLPLLIGPNKIKEVDGGITFGGAFKTPCTGENWTGYNGIINNNGNPNNTSKSVLPADQFLELKKRSGEKQAYVRNAIITDLNSKNLSPEQLTDAQFDHDILSNIHFKNCDFSKIKMNFVVGDGDWEFEDTILPYSMGNSGIGRLTLKNVTFPKEEFKNMGRKIEYLPYFAPEIGTLTIYGEIKDSPLKDLTQEQIEKLKNDKYRPFEMPGLYKGPQETYDRLKYIYRGESNTKEFVNLHGSIQKPQDTFLALLGNGKAHG